MDSAEETVIVKIALTADEELVARARAYAQARNTTLDQLVSDYLRRLTGQIDAEQAAKDFAEVARHQAGCSDEGFRFDRGAVS